MRIILMLSLLLFGGPSFTFSPPADFILAEMIKHCLNGTARFKGIELKEKPVFLNLSLRREGLFIVDKMTHEERLPLFVLEHLLDCEAAKKIKAYLVSHGVDTKKVSQGFFNFDPVFIIGADPKDTTSPQLFISKDFLPVKEKIGDKEIIYEHWTALNSIAGKRWPRQIIIDKTQLSLAEIDP